MRKRPVLIGILVALGLAVLLGGALLARRPKVSALRAGPSAGQVPPPPFEVAEVVLDAGLGAGWKDYGRGKRELDPGQPTRVSFGGFGTLELGHERLTARFGALRFRVRAPERYGEFLALALALSDQPVSKFPLVPVVAPTPLSGGWREVHVPFEALNPEGLPFDRIIIKARRMVPDEMVELDHLVLGKPTNGVSVSGTPTRSSFLLIDCSAPEKPISPLIYGIAHGTNQAGETAHRIGGNAMTRLNWDAGDLWNTGSDWFFENVRGDTKLTSWLDEARESGVKLALTVPMIGWVAKDATSSGFPRSRFPQQRKFDEHRPEAGDGYTPAGEPIAPGPPSLTSEAAPPERILRWVEAVRERDRASGKRAVALYMLDNEPDLWHVTHRDLHPQPVSYDELLERTTRYASAVRKADPDAVIAGPASWGWSGYFFSAKDSAGAPGLHLDRRQHGGKALLPWYLERLAAHERRTGERLLDLLDVHYYPQAAGVYGGSPAPGVEVGALRLRSTRSLWDPAYVDESWIQEPVQLLPRLRRWVAENYPGRGIVLGEWSFGGEQDITGALATAEALGRFGQHGVHAAFYWNKPGPETKTFWGFRAFRNYDGAGARFLDTSVSTQSSPELSAFASRDGEGNVVLILVNLDATYAAELDFASRACGSLQRKRVFAYRGSNEGIVADPQTVPGMRGLRVAPHSIEIVELRVER